VKFNPVGRTSTDSGPPPKLAKLPRAVVRQPLVKIERAEIMRIRQGLIEVGLLDKSARDAA
jgi:4-hydroxy-tetrahydrodipicolinate synthase